MHRQHQPRLGTQGAPGTGLRPPALPPRSEGHVRRRRQQWDLPSTHSPSTGETPTPHLTSPTAILTAAPTVSDIAPHDEPSKASVKPMKLRWRCGIHFYGPDSRRGGTGAWWKRRKKCEPLPQEWAGGWEGPLGANWHLQIDCTSAPVCKSTEPCLWRSNP